MDRYAHEGVRADRLAVAAEVLTDYPTDGIELNFLDYSPFLARDEVAEHASSLTGWLRDVRAAADS